MLLFVLAALVTYTEIETNALMMVNKKFSAISAIFTTFVVANFSVIYNDFPLARLTEWALLTRLTSQLDCKSNQPRCVYYYYP